MRARQTRRSMRSLRYIMRRGRSWTALLASRRSSRSSQPVAPESSSKPPVVQIKQSRSTIRGQMSSCSPKIASERGAPARLGTDGDAVALQRMRSVTAAPSPVASYCPDQYTSHASAMRCWCRTHSPKPASSHRNFRLRPHDDSDVDATPPSGRLPAGADDGDG